MKIFKKIILSLFILLIVILFSGGLTIYFYGEPLVKRILKEKLDQDVTFSSITYHVPFGMNVTNLQWGVNFQVKKVSMQFDPTSFLGSRIRILSCNMEEPFLRVVFSLPQEGSPGSSAPTNKEEIGAAKGQNQKGSKYFLWIHSLVVQDGRLAYSRDGSIVEISDILLRANNILLPSVGLDIKLQFSGIIKQPRNFLSESFVSGEGWVNWLSKNMQARLQIIAPSKEGRLLLEMVSKNNDLKVNGHINTAKELLQKTGSRQDNASKEGVLANMLTTMGLGVGADFSFVTKMDDFKLEKISFSGKVIQNNP